MRTTLLALVSLSAACSVTPLSIDVRFGNYFAVVYARDDATTCGCATFPAEGVCANSDGDIACSCPGDVDPLASCLTKLDISGFTKTPAGGPQVFGSVAFPLAINSVDPTTADLALELEGCGSSATIALPKLPAHAPKITSASPSAIALESQTPHVESGCGQPPSSTITLGADEELLEGPHVVQTPYGDARIWFDFQSFNNVAAASDNGDGTFSVAVPGMDFELTSGDGDGYAGARDVVVRVDADGAPLSLDATVEADSVTPAFPIAAIRATFTGGGDRVELDMNGTTFAATLPHAYRGGGLDEAQGFAVDVVGPAHFDDILGSAPSIDATSIALHIFTRTLMVSRLGP